MGTLVTNFHMHLPVNLKWFSLVSGLFTEIAACLARFLHPLQLAHQRHFCALKLITMTSQVVQGSWFYTGGYRCFRNKKCYTFFKETLRVSTQTIRTGSQDCSTKKKVSVLIINSLLHAVMSSIHCAGAGYFFLKATRGERAKGRAPLLLSLRASSRFLP